MQSPDRMDRRTFLNRSVVMLAGAFLASCGEATPGKKPPVQKRIIDGDGWDVTELAPGVVEIEVDFSLGGRGKALDKVEEGLRYVAERCEISAVSRDPDGSIDFIATLSSSDKDGSCLFGD